MWWFSTSQGSTLQMLSPGALWLTAVKNTLTICGVTGGKCTCLITKTWQNPHSYTTGWRDEKDSAVHQEWVAFKDITASVPAWILFCLSSPLWDWWTGFVSRQTGRPFWAYIRSVSTATQEPHRHVCNATQFTSSEFQDFCQSYGFAHKPQGKRCYGATCTDCSVNLKSAWSIFCFDVI